MWKKLCAGAVILGAEVEDVASVVVLLIIAWVVLFKIYFLIFFKLLLLWKSFGAGAVRVYDSGAVKLDGGGRLMVLTLLYDEATLVLINFE